MKDLLNPVKSILILSAILISGCNYYSPEVKKASEKYGIDLDEAERCHSTFRENTEVVLDWVEENKSWFFGLFSENCDDLIAQLPPFGRYDNLLAAKDNNWKVDDPAYKNYLIKRNKEIAEEEKIAPPNTIWLATKMVINTALLHDPLWREDTLKI